MPDSITFRSTIPPPVTMYRRLIYCGMAGVEHTSAISAICAITNNNLLFEFCSAPPVKNIHTNR